MIESIRNCEKCELCKNQCPLLETCTHCQVIWVGLSAKKVKVDGEGPLSTETNSGKHIKIVEDACNGISTYKTNLVKCLPLNDKNKLRYPNRIEIENCICNLMDEIDYLQPRIVFLLGEKVYSAVGKCIKVRFEKWNGFEYSYKECNGVYYVPVHHPSYISVYKRKNIDMYIQGIKKVIDELVQADDDV